MRFTTHSSSSSLLSLISLIASTLSSPTPQTSSPSTPPPYLQSAHLRFHLHTLPTSPQNTSLTGLLVHQLEDASPNYWDFSAFPNTSPSSTAYSDSFFYPNGTAEQIASGQTSMGGYSQYGGFYPALNLDKLSQMGPNGVTVASVVHVLTGAQNPNIWMTPPTLGVKVEVDQEDGIARLKAPGDREWYVCQKVRRVHAADFTLLLIYTKGSGEETPNECADVEIIPQCAQFDQGGVYAGGEFEFEVPCYENAGVVWS
ncbi:MAG: hypothetical protein Q9160_005824 [Pyrenula sp. 1 TL-2023]